MKALAALLLSTLCMAVPKAEESPAIRAASDLLQQLDETQRAKLRVPFSDPERFKWAFVPMPRKGIAWNEFSPMQQQFARRLLQASLSVQGYEKVEEIRQLELVLRELENNNLNRNPEKYWFAIYGQPGQKEKWGWRYEGHHVSLTFAYEKGITIASTPQFLGSNPGEVPTGPLKGKRALSHAQDEGFAMLKMLASEQRTKAVISTEAPPDILTMNAIRAKIDSKDGLYARDLNSAQLRQLKKLLEAHARIQIKAEADRRVKEAMSDPELRFVWMGSDTPGKGHYYRIQGKTFVVEYDNTQNGANHVHTVWRNFDEDFGGDALAEHLATSDHHHPHRH